MKYLQIILVALAVVFALIYLGKKFFGKSQKDDNCGSNCGCA